MVHILIILHLILLYVFSGITRYVKMGELIYSCLVGNANKINIDILLF